MGHRLHVIHTDRVGSQKGDVMHGNSRVYAIDCEGKTEGLGEWAMLLGECVTFDTRLGC